MTPAIYAAILTATVAGCWYGGIWAERLLPKAPWVVRRMAYLLLTLAMVRGLLRWFV